MGRDPDGDGDVQGRRARPEVMGLDHRKLEKDRTLLDLPIPALEALREPLERRRVTVARASGSVSASRCGSCSVSGALGVPA